MLQKSTSLKYEPSLELLRVTAEQLFWNVYTFELPETSPNFLEKTRRHVTCTMFVLKH